MSKHTHKRAVSLALVFMLLLAMTAPSFAGNSPVLFTVPANDKNTVLTFNGWSVDAVFADIDTEDFLHRSSDDLELTVTADAPTFSISARLKNNGQVRYIGIEKPVDAGTFDGKTWNIPVSTAANMDLTGWKTAAVFPDTYDGVIDWTPGGDKIGVVATASSLDAIVKLSNNGRVKYIGINNALPPPPSSACDVLSVTSPSGAYINATSITATVAKNVTSRQIAVTVSAKASWKLYSNAGCTTEITNKTMTLAEGENTAYIRVTAEDATTKDYTVVITRAVDHEYSGTQAGKPTLNVKADTYVALTAVTVTGKTVEYGVNTTDSAPASGWQDSPIFTGLSASTTYYFFARVRAIPGTHLAGTASASLSVTTDTAFDPNEMKTDEIFNGSHTVNNYSFLINRPGENDQSGNTRANFDFDVIVQGTTLTVEYSGSGIGLVLQDIEWGSTAIAADTNAGGVATFDLGKLPDTLYAKFKTRDVGMIYAFVITGNGVTVSKVSVSYPAKVLKGFMTWAEAGKAAQVNTGDITRVAEVLKKAKRGEDVNIVYFGGSITEGVGVTDKSKMWAQVVHKWFTDTYGSNVKYINASIGGIGSASDSYNNSRESEWGINRLQTAVLDKKPDLVFVEFSVNDGGYANYGKRVPHAYEAIIRRLLEEDVAVIIFNTMNFDSGGNVQAMHNTIAEHYSIPAISGKNGLWTNLKLSIAKTPMIGSELPTRDEFGVPDDPLHPGEGGYNAYAQMVLYTLKELDGIKDTVTSSPVAIPSLFYPNNMYYAITLKAIAGVTAPAVGALPVSSVTETTQYTATVSWSPAIAAGGRFAPGTVYTATITLTPKKGYMLSGITANSFTVAGATATNAADSGVITAVFKATGAENKYEPTSANVKFLGRSYFNTNAANKGLWGAQSGTGCEFTVTGTYAKVTVLGDNSAGATGGNRARIVILRNGVRYIDELMLAKEMTFTVLQDAEPGTNTKITVMKVSEAADSMFGIKEILTDGTIAPTSKQPFLIEFIGDSITCGYGIDASSGSYSTATEDFSKAYAYKTAKLLNADYSIVARSGAGFISHYTGTPGTPGNASQPSNIYSMPSMYDSYGHSWQQSSVAGFNPSTLTWDFAVNRRPDIVVVNLGTNDGNYVGSDAGKKATFELDLIEFTKAIRTRNPDALIVWAYGAMEDNLYSNIANAVATYTAQTTDTNVTSMKFDKQNTGADGMGIDWHPSVATADKMTTKLASFLSPYLPSADVSGVTLDQSTLSLRPGQNKPLLETVLPTNAGNKSVSWSSSNSAVASVSQQGVVTAHTIGRATITVTTAEGPYEAKCEVEVSAGVIQVWTGSKAVTSNLNYFDGNIVTITAGTNFETSDLEPGLALIMEYTGTDAPSIMVRRQKGTAANVSFIAPDVVADGKAVFTYETLKSILETRDAGLEFGTIALITVLGRRQSASPTTIKSIYISDTLGFTITGTEVRDALDINWGYDIWNPNPKYTLALDMALDHDDNKIKKPPVTIEAYNASGNTITWASANTAIAAVATDGTITAVATGQTTVTGTLTTSAGTKLVVTVDINVAAAGPAVYGTKLFEGSEGVGGQDYFTIVTPTMDSGGFRVNCANAYWTRSNAFYVTCDSAVTAAALKFKHSVYYLPNVLSPHTLTDNPAVAVFFLGDLPEGRNPLPDSYSALMGSGKVLKIEVGPYTP